jgi:hypothetical protein
MRPASIRVFDGLRITTDHLEHLQGSFQSALRELRLVAGPGRVDHGFEVEVIDDGRLRVLPGVAFDAAGNRIACDEPTDLEVAPATGAPGERYVCLRHRQVEDGVVEGRATMVWDGCSVELADAWPEPDSGLLPIAALARPELGTGVQVRPVAAGRWPGRDDAAAAPGWLRLGQGVVRLDGGVDDPLASAAFWEELAQPTGADGDQQVTRTLAEQDVATELACCASVSVAAILTATIRYRATVPVEAPAPAGEQPEAAAPADEPAPAWTTRTVQGRASGEATLDGDRVAQFGLVDVHALPSPGAGHPPCWLGSYLTEEAVACLPLRPGGDWPAAEDGIDQLLGGLELWVLAAPGRVTGSFTLRCDLRWSGRPTAGLGELITARTPRLQWGVVAAWKGLGHATPAQDATGGS